MIFTSPSWLWALSFVAAAALWAMFRPARKYIDVASLSLWQEALAAVPPAARRARKVSASWLLLLAGAAAGAVALAGPVVRREAPARHVAIALRPSAELARGAGLAEMRQAVAALIGQLTGDDRVQLLLPAATGGATEWLAPAAARERIERLELLWAPADQVDLPRASPDAQHTWIFTPAGAADFAGPNVSVVILAAHLPPVTIDAVAAVPDGQRGVRLFVALRNQTDRAQNVAATAVADDREKSSPVPVALPSLLLGPGERGSVCAFVAGRKTIHVMTASDPAERDDAWLVRRERPRAKVAMVGPDELLLRRFISVSPGLELTGTPGEAEVIFANAPGPGDVPPGKPALVIDPQGAAGAIGGWTRADASVTVVSPPVTAPQDAVMRDVSLAGLALRQVRPWGRQSGGAAPVVELARSEKGALILRSDSSGVAAVGESRRVYLAFDLGAENAHFDRPEMLPIFLANATGWLLGDRPATVTYEALTPAQAGPGVLHPRLWERADVQSSAAGTLPAPGLYVDRERTWHAVNLTGLRAPPAAPQDPVARRPLPDPRPARRDVPLWPVFVLAAMALWLGGWTARWA